MKFLGLKTAMVIDDVQKLLKNSLLPENTGLPPARSPTTAMYSLT